MKKKLSQIAEIRSGHLFKEGIKPDKEGAVSVIQLKDVSDRGILNTQELQRVNLDKTGSENFISVGDVLLKAKTNRPVSAVIKEPLSNTIATAHYFIITLKKPDILPGYLSWYLNQRPAQVYFNRNAGGTRIQVINKQLLGELEVILPDVRTQEEIEKIHELHLREQSIMETLKEKKRDLVSAQLLSMILK